MSMLSCRVLCLLAIVLCCVGVAHAAAAAASLPSHVMEIVDQAKKLAEGTKELKEKCVKAGEAARQAGEEAHVFAHETKTNLETIAADPPKVEETKSKGLKLIDKVMKVAEDAENVANKTTDSERETDEKANLVLLSVPNPETPPEEIKGVLKEVEDAQKAVREAAEEIDAAKTYANKVKDALQDLEAAVVAAKEKKEKQVETQTQEQTNETSLDEQQGHTEGNQAEQTQETQSSSNAPDVHETSAIPLPTNATITNGTKRNDGSSSPALLRVPLLLLLLLSVLGCMAVC
ncbi:uncharacterized protein TM35_000023820 [Trypanosoma theileri]|uniref:Surface protein TolT n=1 Tax=Trypanosoma theileri TaxID=67003 RepID=A0A1X0P7Y6_9TRYP|nr:uncharacterized protein TM35_000023820 [Trypanosoma theileri]ORC93056.1 hypothetical protein TM35_000023820 [Trypanosoma theileri]